MILAERAARVEAEAVAARAQAPGVAEQRCELAPGIRRTHVDDADGLDPWPRRLDAE